MIMMGVVGLESTRTKATWNFTLRVLGLLSTRFYGVASKMGDPARIVGLHTVMLIDSI